MYENLKYSDEADRSLGIAGMAIALMACEGEDYIAKVSLEDGDETIEFSQEAFFVSNPRFSAKIAWNQMMREYHIFTGMLLGNVICRQVLTNKNVKEELVEMLHDLIAEHGMHNCSLDEDEVNELFNKDLRYFRRLFSHPAVSDVARDFALNLRVHRRMTAGEVFENLSRLATM